LAWSLYLSRITFAAASLLAAVGCSRLAGDHDAEPDAQEAARMERLLNDMPESLATKRDKKSANTTNSESAVASGVQPSSVMPASGAVLQSTPVQTAPVPTTKRSTVDPRPTAGRKPKKSVRTVNKADEIPDAADIGL
jgi:hypothetical protein